MLRLAAIAALLTGLSTVVVACTAGDIAGAGELDESPVTERFAIVVFTYSEDAQDNRDDLVAQAWFVARDSATDIALAHVLDVPAVLRLDPDVPAETCRVETRAVDGFADAPETRFSTAGPEISLLDAGALTVATNGHTVPLDSFWFPDVNPAIAGLAYAGELRDTASFDDGAPLGVSADGSDEVGPFAVAIAPPAPMRLEATAFEPSGFLVEWEGAETPSDVTAPVVINFVRRGYDTVSTVMCAAYDDGHFVIPTAVMDGLADLGDDATDRLVIERTLHRAFEATGISGGFVMAVAQDTVLVR